MANWFNNRTGEFELRVRIINRSSRAVNYLKYQEISEMNFRDALRQSAESLRRKLNINVKRV